jgi:hypothetical protein
MANPDLFVFQSANLCLAHELLQVWHFHNLKRKKSSGKIVLQQERIVSTGFPSQHRIAGNLRWNAH